MMHGQKNIKRWRCLQVAEHHDQEPTFHNLQIQTKSSSEEGEEPES